MPYYLESALIVMLGLIGIVIGCINISGRFFLVNKLAVQRISKENTRIAAAIVGLSMIILGISVIAIGILHLIGESSGEGLSTAKQMVVIIGFSLFFILRIFAGIKYAKCAAL